MTRRVVLIVLGGVLLALGALTAIGGGALMALFGSSDTELRRQQASTPTRALVSPVAAIQKSTGVQTVFGPSGCAPPRTRVPELDAAGTVIGGRRRVTGSAVSDEVFGIDRDPSPITRAPARTSSPGSRASSPSARPGRRGIRADRHAGPAWTPGGSSQDSTC